MDDRLVIQKARELCEVAERSFLGGYDIHKWKNFMGNFERGKLLLDLLDALSQPYSGHKPPHYQRELDTLMASLRTGLSQ